MAISTSKSGLILGLISSRDDCKSTTSTFVSTWAAFGVRQSIFHCGNEATPATAAESGLFVLSSTCCKGLKHDRVLPDRQHYYDQPNRYGQPESAGKLP